MVYPSLLVAFFVARRLVRLTISTGSGRSYRRCVSMNLSTPSLLSALHSLLCKLQLQLLQVKEHLAARMESPGMPMTTVFFFYHSSVLFSSYNPKPINSNTLLSAHLYIYPRWLGSCPSPSLILLWNGSRQLPP